MRVGHGAATIEVIAGEPMGGYVARAGGLSGVLDPLEVHAISIASDGARFVLIVIDVVCVNVDLVEMIRDRLGSDVATTVWVAATHTHSAPESGCRPGGGTTPPTVADRLTTAAVVAATAAVADERDAAIKHVLSTCAGVAGRRTDPTPDAIEVPVDAVLVCDSVTESVLGTLIVTPVHPTVLPADNRAASADLNGAIRLAAKRRWGGWSVAVTGAAGDISTRGARRGRDAGELARLAALIVGALPDAPPEDTPLETLRRSVAHGELAANDMDAESLGSTVIDRGGATRWREVYEQGRRALIDLGGRHRPEPLPIAVEAVVAGSVYLVAIPGEPFLALGERIRAETGAVVLGYTNGYVGYLPVTGTPVTYETIVSPVRPEGADRIVHLVSEAVSALREVAEKR